ncbi:MAG: hypothetical protein EPO07_07625 [Verrucomicrobia bacterium]|nr:MAG: hypothetical protein EPO07_07625 [Verrucomicrobiota bacterium]
MMEWLSEDPKRGQVALTFIAIGITAILIWLGVILLGRKKLLITMAVAFAWLLLAAIAIPSFIPARNGAYRNACINNLKEIREAKASWAKAEHKLPTDTPTEVDLYGTFGTNGILRHKFVCPRGGKYTIGPAGENPTCSLADKGHKLE